MEQCGHIIYVNDLFTRGALQFQCVLDAGHDGHHNGPTLEVHDPSGRPINASLEWEA